MKMIVATVMVVVQQLLLQQAELLSVMIVYTISQTMVLSAAILHGMNLVSIALH